MSVTKILAGTIFSRNHIAGFRTDDKFKVCADPLNPPYSTKNKGGFENKICRIICQGTGAKS